MFFALAMLSVAALGILGAIVGALAPSQEYEPPRIYDYGSEPPRDLRLVDGSQRAAIDALTFTDTDEWDLALGHGRH
jgi:hypothetical protein